MGPRNRVCQVDVEVEKPDVIFERWDRIPRREA